MNFTTKPLAPGVFWMFAVPAGRKWKFCAELKGKALSVPDCVGRGVVQVQVVVKLQLPLELFRVAG